MEAGGAGLTREIARERSRRQQYWAPKYRSQNTFLESDEAGTPMLPRYRGSTYIAADEQLRNDRTGQVCKRSAHVYYCIEARATPERPEPRPTARASDVQAPSRPTAQSPVLVCK
jgi:hypothetical protein